MVKHIVMWKLKERAEGTNKKENAFQIKKRVENLITKMAYIKKIEVGINQQESEQSDDVVLYSEFETWEDLEHYKKHPEHMKVAEFIGKVRLERRTVDYETEKD